MQIARNSRPRSRRQRGHKMARAVKREKRRRKGRRRGRWHGIGVEQVECNEFGSEDMVRIG